MAHSIGRTFLWAVFLTAAARCAVAQDLPPPGDCTPEQHVTLQAAVDAACSVPARCTNADDCATLLANYNQHIACANARDTINNTCFRGGNKGHREQAQNRRNGAERCRMIMLRKRCADCP